MSKMCRIPYPFARKGVVDESGSEAYDGVLSVYLSGVVGSWRKVMGCYQA